MVGFELNIKDKSIAAALKNGVVTIILTISSKDSNEPISLNFGGLDTSKKGDDVFVDWYNAPLEVGDKISISVKEVLENSSPTQVRPKKHKKKDELDLESYYSLKKRLEAKGLI